MIAVFIVTVLAQVITSALLIAHAIKLRIARDEARALEAENETLRAQLAEMVRLCQPPSYIFRQVKEFPITVSWPKLCPLNGKPCDGKPVSEFCDCAPISDLIRRFPGGVH